MRKRVTPMLIERLRENQVFVFGSNLAGIHGKGAAKTALNWGAKSGQPYGLQGDSYAIPTKDVSIKNTLPLEEIKVFVDDFIIHAKNNPGTVFLVTEIGCGLAGLKPKAVAPLFKDVINLKNVWLPEAFWKVIT